MPIEFNKGIIFKLKKFFCKLFSLFNHKKPSKQEEEIEKNKNNNFSDSFRKNIRKEESIKEIINLIEKNPNVLNNLPLNKLEKLNFMYDEKINQNRQEIERLKIEIKSINKKCIKLAQ